MLNEICLGWLGLHPWEFERYSIGELYIKLTGYLDRYNDTNAEEWRQTRLIVSTLYTVAGKSYEGLIKPEQIIKLPGDEASATKIEQMREAFKKMQKNG